jgi:hypothetical protein
MPDAAGILPSMDAHFFSMLGFVLLPLRWGAGLMALMMLGFVMHTQQSIQVRCHRAALLVPQWYIKW